VHWGGTMRHLKIWHLLTVLTLTISSLFAASDPTAIQVRFGPNEDQADNLDKHFIRFVKKAKKTLDGAFFEFRLDSIVDALIAAHEKGVRVRLVTDDANYYLTDHSTGTTDKEQMNPFAARLVAAGIEVVHDARSGLMHNKFAVVDSAWVWSGSYNLTDSCSAKNENNAIWLKNEELAAIFTREFEEMFVDRQFGIRSPSQLDSQTVMVNGSKVEVLFGPEDNPMGRLNELLSEAEESIYFMEFAMTHDGLGDTMIQKHREGLTVRGIFDRMLYRSTGPYAEFAKLTAAGVPVVVYESPYRGKMHHKVFIIDAKGKNPKVALGSGNASANGNKANDENVIIIHDKEIVEQYLQNFRSLYGRTSRVVATFHNFRNLTPATRVPRLSLIITSNGVQTQKLKIQFPPRWPVYDEQVGLKIYRLRKGRQVDTTAKEDFTLTQRDVVIHSANLAKTGEESVIIVKVTNCLTPEITGRYNLYLEAKSPNSGFYPLASQPVLYVGEVADLGFGSPEFFEDAAAILKDLVSQKYDLLQGSISDCEDHGICDLWGNHEFHARVKMLLESAVTVFHSDEAADLLKRIQGFDLKQAARVRIFETLYSEDEGE